MPRSLPPAERGDGKATRSPSACGANEVLDLVPGPSAFGLAAADGAYEGRLSSGVPARQRSAGRIAVAFAAENGRTRIDALSESGPLRLRVPRGAGRPLDAVLLNTGGGVACGDRLSISADAGPDIDAVLTSQAAERIYRSDGAEAAIAVRLTVGPRARLDWLPQETILYDRARLRRRFEVDVAEGGALLAYESVVFGRVASGETVAEGLLHDVWRVRRGGKLVFADTLRLAGPISAQLDREAIGGGCRALATLLHIAPDAETRLDEARSLLASAGCRCGAGAWRGCLVVRFLAPEIGLLRTAAARFLEGFRGREMPRVWML